jgi:hypothetical protein
MKDRKTLTKSLHTATVVATVALLQASASNTTITAKNAPKLVSDALDLLGHVGPWDADDATVLACIKTLLKKAGA